MGGFAPATPKPWEVPITAVPGVLPQPAPAPTPAPAAGGLAAMLGSLFGAVPSTQQIAGQVPPQPQTTPEEQIQRRELFKKFGNPQ